MNTLMQNGAGCSSTKAVNGGLYSPPIDNGPITPNTPNPSLINELGFSYLFREKNISEDQVKLAMLSTDGVVRYSQQLSLSSGRSLAVVLFRAAQLVFGGRSGNDPHAIKIGDQFVVQGSRIHTDADLSGEEVIDAMAYLTKIGVFTRYAAERSGEQLFNDWYTFSDENEYFPAHGQLKFS